MTGDYRGRLKSSRRIVVKIGTSTITYPTGQLNLYRMEKLAAELADLRNQGRDVVLVSSGAQGAGLGRLKLKSMPKTIPMRQALAAVGQGTLVQMYEKYLSEYGQIAAQVLLTRDDFAQRERYLNARNALLTLLSLGVVPVINENDTVAFEEIKFGDNDTLSAMVAGIVDADLLIILSDIDGLYTSDPRKHHDAVMISEVDEVTPEMEEHSHSKGSQLSSGGMYTKLLAAKMAMASGIPMVLAEGSEPGKIRDIVMGERVGTLFVPREEKMHARDRWLAYGSHPEGVLFIDAGAGDALVNRGKSLLPSGIKGIEGEFGRGAVVKIMVQDQEVARGIVNYSSGELAAIAGKKSSEIKACLGSKDYDEAVHRNNMIILGP